MTATKSQGMKLGVVGGGKKNIIWLYFTRVKHAKERLT